MKDIVKFVYIEWPHYDLPSIAELKNKTFIITSVEIFSYPYSKDEKYAVVEVEDKKKYRVDTKLSEMRKLFKSLMNIKHFIENNNKNVEVSLREITNLMIGDYWIFE